MFLSATCPVCDSRWVGSDVVCPRCAGSIESTRQAVDAWPRAVFELDPVVRNLVAALKYKRERRLADWCATHLVPLVPRAADLITWVPATPSRVRQRGYDQAAELARRAGAKTGVPTAATLRRSSSDGRQTERDRAGRALGPNLESLRPVAGLVVVVDDVITTGSTIQVASRVLAGSGAERVVGLALARTPLRAEG